MLVVALTHTELAWYGVPISVFPGMALVSGAFLACFLIWSLHLWFVTPGEYSKRSLNIANQALVVLKVLAVLLVITQVLLFIRVDVPTDKTRFLAYDAMNTQLWVITRLVMGFCVVPAFWFFDRTAYFRFYTCMLLPCLAACDMISHYVYIKQIFCVETGVCPQRSDFYELNAMAWRDIVSIFLFATSTLFCFWLCSLLGWFSNILSTPRYEHRKLAKFIDTLNLNPIFSRKNRRAEQQKIKKQFLKER